MQGVFGIGKGWDRSSPCRYIRWLIGKQAYSLQYRRRSTIGRSLWETIQTIVIAFLLAMLIRHFVVESFVVEGHSMEPTLHHGERLLVNKLAYRFQDAKRGDIVVFRYPEDPSKDFIKRIIATEGDTVEIVDGKVYVNGEALEEPYVADHGRDHLPPTQVPSGTIFVLGDNRRNSQDSRYFGPVSEELLEGKAVLIWWPFAFFQTLP